MMLSNGLMVQRPLMFAAMLGAGLIGLDGMAGWPMIRSSPVGAIVSCVLLLELAAQRA
jgi:hypothetical protein